MAWGTASSDQKTGVCLLSWSLIAARPADVGGEVNVAGRWFPPVLELSLPFSDPQRPTVFPRGSLGVPALRLSGLISSVCDLEMVSREAWIPEVMFRPWKGGEGD